jgi:hypothetical protein
MLGVDWPCTQERLPSAEMNTAGTEVEADPDVHGEETMRQSEKVQNKTNREIENMAQYRTEWSQFVSALCDSGRDEVDGDK